jgi:hypothetical protein
MGKIDAGDTLTIGLDYYYLTAVSPHFSVNLSEASYLRLENDEVITIKMWKEKGLVCFREYKN